MADFFQVPDVYMIDYYPYSSCPEYHTPGSCSQMLSYLKQGFNSQPISDFEHEVFQWLCSEVSKFENETVVIAVAPGHAENYNPTGFMHEMVKGASQCVGGVHDGGQQLIRTKTVPKQAQTPGPRSEATHRGTIALKPLCQRPDGSYVYPDNSGKIVIILDDILTSGSTLRVCKEVMEESNPKEVKLFAVGKTTYPQ